MSQDKGTELIHLHLSKSYSTSNYKKVKWKWLLIMNEAYLQIILHEPINFDVL